MLPEQLIYVVVADNLDLACSFMEKAAAEKSILEIDEQLAPSYANRRKQRERAQPFYDMAVLGGSRYPSALPDLLRLKTSGLTNQQLGVYEDFGRPKATLVSPGFTLIYQGSETPSKRAAQPTPQATQEQPEGISLTVGIEKASV